MSEYTIVHLEDVEETSSDGLPGIEGKFARRRLESDQLGVSWFRYAPGVRSPIAHHHREQEEVYVVIGGSGRIMLGDEVRAIRSGDLVRVSPSVLRAMEAGPDGLEVIAVGSRRPEGGGGVTIPAPWRD
jgi:mannose-6-phosphate isomerase-like protein (cupin superfamily)